MRKRWIPALFVALMGVSLGACTDLTSPRYPQEEKDPDGDKQKPDDQAMILQLGDAFRC